MTPAEEDALVEQFAMKNGTGEGERIRLAIRAAVAAERERCAKEIRNLYDFWMQEHGGETPFDAGRLGGLYSAEEAIRRGDD